MYLSEDLSSIEGSDSDDDASPENETSSAVSKLMERIAQIPTSEEIDSLAPLEEPSGNKQLINSPKMYYENESGRIFGIYKCFGEVWNRCIYFLEID